MMVRNKNGIATLAMKRLRDIKRYDSIWHIGHKILEALAYRDEGYLLKDIVEMDDALLDGKGKGKRGRGSKKKIPVISAIESDGKRVGHVGIQALSRPEGI